jgi:hypothetical protein
MPIRGNNSVIYDWMTMIRQLLAKEPRSTNETCMLMFTSNIILKKWNCYDAKQQNMAINGLVKWSQLCCA